MKNLLVVLVIGGFCAVSGCGGGTPPPPPPVATQLSVIAPAAASTAGAPFNVTVKALDSSGAVVSSYSGSVHFASSDPQAVLPKDSGLINGAGSFQVIFKTAGNQTVIATDPSNGLVSGSLNSISVNSAAATHFSVSGPSAATVSFPITANVIALDDFANVATSYASTVHLTSSDARAVLPSNSTLANGTGSFSVTLKTTGSQTITATDTVTASITGVTNGINVVTNTPTQITLTGPGSSLTRQTVQLTVSAFDAADNLSVGYSGTLHFTSSDALAKLPQDSALAGGTGTVSATLETAGMETITATDTVKPSLTALTSISVSAALDLVISSGPPPTGTVGARYAPHVVCSGPSCKVTGYGFALKVTGGVSPYSWTWAGQAGSTPPPGLNVTSCLLSGKPFRCIAGIPTQPGAYNVVLTLADSGNPPVETSANYTITINNPPPPVVNTTAPPFPGVQNQPYSFTLTASGYPPLTWSESGALPPGLAFDNNTGSLSGTPTKTGSSPVSVTAADQFQQSSAPANFTIVVNLHGFLPTGSMATARRFHTATRLCNGKVLVAGGEDAGSTPFDSAELYDPLTGTFSPTGNMTVPRVAHTATLLANCKVLLTGGAGDVSEAAVSSAELYDPVTNTFTATSGSMTAARAVHTATLLKDGRVLVAGGDVIFFNGLQNPNIQSLASADLFDPNTGKFTATGSMSQARESYTTTLLNDGKVLIAGGSNGAVGNTNPPATVLGSAELYDPATGKFIAAKNMTTPRDFHTATLLSTGKVLMAGGIAEAGTFLATAELFDPSTGSFSATTGAMAAPRFYHDATALNDGTVLLCGGNDGSSNALATAEIYDPAAGKFATAPSMIDARIWHTSTLLQNGKVLVIGGAHASNALVATAEVYQ